MEDLTKEDLVGLVLYWNKEQYGLATEEDNISHYDSSTTLEIIDGNLVLIQPSTAGIVEKVVYEIENGKITKEVGVWHKNLMDENPSFQPAHN